MKVQTFDGQDDVKVGTWFMNLHSTFRKRRLYGEYGVLKLEVLLCFRP